MGDCHLFYRGEHDTSGVVGMVGSANTSCVDGILSTADMLRSTIARSMSVLLHDRYVHLNILVHLENAMFMSIIYN